MVDAVLAPSEEPLEVWSRANYIISNKRSQQRTPLSRKERVRAWDPLPRLPAPSPAQQSAERGDTPEKHSTVLLPEPEPTKRGDD